MKQPITITQQERGWLLSDGTRLAHQDASPVEVIRQVHGYAISKKFSFPLELNVTTKEGTTIPLLVQVNGSTTQNPKTQETGETHAEEENNSPLDKKAPHDVEPQQGTGSHRSDENKVHRAKILAPMGMGLVALLLLGGCTAYFLAQPKDDEGENAATAPATQSTEQPIIYEIPEDEKDVSLAGTYLVGSQDDQLKVTDVLTGKSVLKEGVTISPDNLRAQSYRGKTIIDGGKGKVLLLHNGKQESFDGAMNTRGTVPVIVSKDFKKYTLIGQSEKEIPEKSSLLGATDKNLLFVKSPAKIEYSKDGRTVEVEPPTKNAKLAAWIAGTETRAVTVWKKDSTTWLVVTDTQNKGKTVLKEEIPNLQAVSYAHGHVIVSDKQFLEDDRLQNLCEPGKWIEGNRWCEENGQWSYKDQSLTTEPELLTDQYLVTENKVKER